MTVEPIIDLQKPFDSNLFVVGMAWSSIGDIDLRVNEPALSTPTQFVSNLGVFYGYPYGNFGYLDQDIIHVPGTDGEHYYARSVNDPAWTEDINGKLFEIRPNNFSAPENQPFILAISSDQFDWDWTDSYPGFNWNDYSSWGTFTSAADLKSSKIFSKNILDIGPPTGGLQTEIYAWVYVMGSEVIDFSGLPVPPSSQNSIIGNLFVVKPMPTTGGWMIGKIGSDSRAYVPPVSSAPVARFTYSPAEPAIPSLNNVTFNASTSSISNGSIVSYYWNFGNGQTGEGVSASTTYNSSGSYTVSLTVVSDAGVMSSTSQQITVKSISTFEYVGAGGGAVSTAGFTVMDVPINIPSLQGNELLFLIVRGYSENSQILWEADYQNGDIASGWIEIGEQVNVKYGTNTYYSLSVFCHINSGQTSTQLALINYPSYNFNVRAQVLAYENNGGVNSSMNYATASLNSFNAGSYTPSYSGRVVEIASQLGVSGQFNTDGTLNGFVRRANLTNTPATLVLDKAVEAGVSDTYPTISSGFSKPWMAKTFFLA